MNFLTSSSCSSVENKWATKISARISLEITKESIFEVLTRSCMLVAITQNGSFEILDFKK